MARSIALIQQQIIDNVTADPTLGPLLTSQSKRAIYILWTFIQATAIAIAEQIIDVFSASVEATAAAAAPASAAWLQAQILKFQYSDTVPQIIQFINFAPSYPVVDPALCIISQCSVTTDISNNVSAKVATGNPPGAISSPQLSALQSFINQIGVAGVTYGAISLDPDQLYLQAQIYYLGQYGVAIQQTVITAITNFLLNASQTNFNGQIKISDIENVIRNVPGVTDVLFQNISARDASTTFGSGTSLILTNTVISRLWQTVAGYIIPETTSGQTLADTLTFIPE